MTKLWHLIVLKLMKANLNGYPLFRRKNSLFIYFICLKKHFKYCLKHKTISKLNLHRILRSVKTWDSYKYERREGRKMAMSLYLFIIIVTSWMFNIYLLRNCLGIVFLLLQKLRNHYFLLSSSNTDLWESKSSVINIKSL